VATVGESFSAFVHDILENECNYTNFRLLVTAALPSRAELCIQTTDGSTVAQLAIKWCGGRPDNDDAMCTLTQYRSLLVTMVVIVSLSTSTVCCYKPIINSMALDSVADF